MQYMKAFRACARVAMCGIVALPLLGQAQVSPANAERKPGLAVCYMYKLVRHVDEIATWEKHLQCEPGEALPTLDYYGGDAKVLTSKEDDGVMAKISGLIHLDKAGAYKFAFESNDGVRLKIDGKQIVEDPGVHSDQFSDLGTMDVTTPGWHPISVEFFERRHTWTLRLLWRPAGSDGDLVPVPAAALSH